jgi:hypothetical protein
MFDAMSKRRDECALRNFASYGGVLSSGNVEPSTSASQKVQDGGHFGNDWLLSVPLYLAQLCFASQSFNVRSWRVDWGTQNWYQ